ncbi:TetR/AcrR family transcriptional regulator [Streptomyces sp. NPDC056486]|uniref:TetR/AcrR family transcriptional regulator n=1 Tax=Streptomyces sp. NPDC056486 TaxID=3345835 RepID=UPI00369C53F5
MLGSARTARTAHRGGTITARKERADSVRNRAALLAAAARLFQDAADPDSVKMADIAQAAGAGKGTVFRHFSDRIGLVRALVVEETQELREQVVDGPPPLGPGTPVAERLPALMSALLDLKLSQRALMLALDRAGTGSPYLNPAYDLWHSEVAGMLVGVHGREGADYLAHVLLAAVRSDLVEHLAGQGASPGQLHAGLRRLCATVLARGADGAEGDL